MNGWMNGCIVGQMNEWMDEKVFHLYPSTVDIGNIILILNTTLILHLSITLTLSLTLIISLTLNPDPKTNHKFKTYPWYKTGGVCVGILSMDGWMDGWTENR